MELGFVVGSFRLGLGVWFLVFFFETVLGNCCYGFDGLKVLFNGQECGTLFVIF